MKDVRARNYVTGALVKYQDNVSDADIVELNIPTGIPLVDDRVTVERE